MPPNVNMDRHENRPHSYSRPSLDQQMDGANNSTQSGSDVRVDGYPSRHHSQGVVASHFMAQGDQETWQQFLLHGDSDPHARSRLGNPTMALESRSQSSPSNYPLLNRPLPRTDSSSSRSSDRKRRLTTADSPMRRPSSIRMHSENAGDTGTNPIVLGSSPATERPLPPPPLQPSQTNPGPSRRQSDIVLPQWQPDSEVTQCPVCGRQFTFLFRKHHCRKCGRVVCSSCSPHRITIPRQFIVHPPSDNSSSIIDLTGDDENAMSAYGPFRNPALGGGEEVRVCNPCVPDPNFNPPPQYNASLPPRHSSRPALPSYVPPPPPPHPRHRSTTSGHNASQTVGHGQSHRARDPFSTSHNDSRRVSYHGGSHPTERWLPPLPGAAGHHHQNYLHSRPVPGAAQSPSSFGSASVSGANSFPRSIFNQMPPALQPQQAQPPRSRRQIAEEDECPICGHELPSKNSDDDDAARTKHIEDCIALHSASPAPIPLTQQTSASLPNQRTRGMSNVEPGNGEGASTSNRMSHAARGMFPYIATEKDCIDDEGHDAECIICLEDFEAGDRMARLVCWCKFHEKCIKEWWDKKGRGACPTHQLQE